MGFETQEEAERWAEGMEQRAKAKKEERLLASAESMTKETLEAIAKSLDAKLIGTKEALQAAYTLGQFDGKMEMAQVGLEMIEKVSK